MNNTVETKLDLVIIELAKSKNMLIDLSKLKDFSYRTLLTNQEAAQFFLTNVRTLFTWRTVYGMPSTKIRTRHYYTWENIKDFLEQHHTCTQIKVA